MSKQKVFLIISFRPMIMRFIPVKSLNNYEGYFSQGFFQFIDIKILVERKKGFLFG